MKHRVNIYICDDDMRFMEIAIGEIERITKEKGQQCNITKCNNAKELLVQYRKLPANIVFLDIEMPDMTGFDAAAELRMANKEVNIVFLTNYDDKVYQSYEYHPFWFVRKSHMNDLDVVVSRFLEKIGFQDDSNYFFDLKISDNKCVSIDIKHIMYFESKNHYIKIVSDNEKEKIVRGRMMDIENQLDMLEFIRIQNSVIVNLRFVAKIKYKMAVLKNDEEINISRDKVGYIKERFQNYLRSNL